MNNRILIVDYEEIARKSLAEILNLEGYEVRTAESAQSAIDLLDEFFDLMILDIQLPGISGVELLKKAAEWSPKTRVIVMTAQPSIENEFSSLYMKECDYIEKPAATSEILLRIQNAFHENHGLEKTEPVLGIPASFKVTHPIKKVIEFDNGASIDLTMRLIYCDGKMVSLTPTENRLLKAFLDCEGQLVEHKRLVSLAQGYETNDWEAPFVLRPIVSRLRHKLDCIPGLNLRIFNIRGSGYVARYGSAGS